MNNYGLALKILRKRFSLTQSELAEKIGVSNHAVSKWENGINQPDVSILQSICALFNVTMDDFLRLASGESEESVFNKDKNENNSEEKSQKANGNGFNFKTLIYIMICACFVSIVVGTIFLIRGCVKGRDEDDGGAPEIGESLELGEQIKGTQTEFLNSVNSAISLTDGISEYDVVGSLKQDDTTTVSISYKLVVDKKSGSIIKYYVNSPYEEIEAYTDFDYVYTTQYGEKVRLGASAIDLSGYIEDLEKPYAKTDITEIKAYKKGYTTQYVFGFTEDYALAELKEFLEELNGVILRDCSGYLVMSSGGMSERITLSFTYQGKDYDFTATRQLNKNSTFTFPNFSEYKAGENVENACVEIENLLSVAKGLNTYTKVLSKNGSEIVTAKVNGTPNKTAVFNISNRPIYFANGKIYDISSNYDGSFPYYKVMSFDDFYSQVTSGVRYKSLLNLDFSISSSFVETIFKSQNGEVTDYTIYLSESGIDYFDDQFGIYLYKNSTVKIIVSAKGESLTKIELIDDDETSYKLALDKTATIILPDFSSYGALIDGTNVISNVKTTNVDQYEFCAEAFVDKDTGDVYTFDDVTVRKYDKNHELIREYAVSYPSGWCIGKLLGIDWNYIYYSVFDDYSRDFYDDNAVYSLNLTTGECLRIATNYSYTQIPVCAVNGVVKYENYHNGLIFDGEYDWDFIYFDSANNILVVRNIIDGDEYIGAYDYDTDTFKKEKNEYISQEWLCGEGYYREQGEDDIVGKYFSYANIGNSSVNFEYLKVVDRHPNRYYEFEIDAKWQIVKDTAKYTFTTFGVYEKSTGNFVYFPRKAEYRFFNGGVHVWDSGLNFFLDDMFWYTFYV